MKGIMFTEENRVLTVNGSKTQTRRILKHDVDFWDDGKPYYLTDFRIPAKSHVNEDGEHFFEIKPRFKVGERVYIQEPYKLIYASCYNSEINVCYPDGEQCTVDCEPLGMTPDECLTLPDRGKKSKSGFCNKMFMPAWAARNFIEIADVKCERLRDISEEDCIKEGMAELNTDNLQQWTNRHDEFVYRSPREAYAALINAIHKGNAWEQNPFVWAYEYKLIKQ
jgi:hypothetical protein